MASKSNDIDYSKKYGNLKILSQDLRSKCNHSVYICECSCGNKIKARGTFLRTGKKTHCGCLNKDNLCDKIFGRLKVISFHGKNKHGHILWKCECECGNFITKEGDVLKRGDSKSCGCLKSENTSAARLKDLTGLIFGKLMVIRRCNKVGSAPQWLCECACGKFCNVLGGNLVNKNSKTCGKCFGGYRYFKKRVVKRDKKWVPNITRYQEKYLGKKYNNLTIVKVIEREDKSPFFECECECGSRLTRRLYSITNSERCKCFHRFYMKSFGNLTVVGKFCIKGKIKCECLCKNIIMVNPTYLKSRTSLSCKSCKEKPKNYKGFYFQSWSNIIAAAKKRGIECSLTIEEAYELLLNQNFICPYSGNVINLGTEKKYSFDRTASLDRIDSNKGYIKDNCEWIAKPLNQMKRGLSKEQFINFCHLAITPSNETAFPILEIPSFIWNRIARPNTRLNKRKIFNVSKEEALVVLKKQEFKCAITGTPLTFAQTPKDVALGLNTASMDRINSLDFGYKNNFWWVHKDVNYLKRDLSMEEFTRICKRVSEYSNAKKRL